MTELNTKPVIYVVTSSQHDDYVIEGVFSTRERADNYVKEYNEDDPSDKARVEEYELDEFENYILKPFWHVSLNLQTNEISTVKYEWQKDEDRKVLADKNKEMEYYEDTGSNIISDMFYVTSYISEEHAHGVCKDRLEHPEKYPLENI